METAVKVIWDPCGLAICALCGADKMTHVVAHMVPILTHVDTTWHDPYWFHMETAAKLLWDPCGLDICAPCGADGMAHVGPT